MKSSAKSSIKRYLIFAAFTFGGFIGGIVVMGLLATNANETFLNNYRIVYRLEQDILAGEAKMKGEGEREIFHLRNIIAERTLPGLRSYEKTAKNHGFFFPFAAPFVERFPAMLGLTSKDIDFSRRLEEATTRARLGLALEKLGRVEDAQVQFERANKLLPEWKGKKSVKDYAKLFPVGDEELQKDISEQFTYPENIKGNYW